MGSAIQQLALTQRRRVPPKPDAVREPDVVGRLQPELPFLLAQLWPLPYVLPQPPPHPLPHPLP